MCQNCVKIVLKLLLKLCNNFTIFRYFDCVRIIINTIVLRKNKCPKNRSALTYWEEKYPSHLDIGKQKYGGPFSVEQVENVKTVLRLIPLLISIVGLCWATELTVNSFSIQNKTPQFISCFIFNDSIYLLVAVVLILLYQLLIYPCVHKFIPSMLKRIGLGLIFALLTTLYYVVMLASIDSFNTSYKTAIIPRSLYGIAFAFIVPTSLEFTIVQCPHEMRGFLVGL